MYSFCTYPIEEFKKLDKNEWLETMKRAHAEYEKEYPKRELHSDQIFAWDDCFDVLQRVLKDFKHPEFYIVFEYVLYLENGCRPDVLLVSGSQVFVLEFKHKDHAPAEDVAQADMYGRFLSTCHMESRTKEIITCLVLTTSKETADHMNGSLHIVSPAVLEELLEDRVAPFGYTVDIEKWEASIYEPDKNSLQRMVDMFEYGKLPHLKSAQSSKIPVASSFLKKLTQRAYTNGEHWLCIVSGVPGAGKTLLGIQYIYEMRKAGSGYEEANATYVSGNGPLLKVLQGQLRYPSFLLSAPSFVKSYNQGRLKDTNLVVFDEAQRMWSEDRMREKNRGGFSENQQIIDIMSGPNWGVLVALIGEGQEIYAGEDGGIEAWVKAVPPDWKVACSPMYAENFKRCAASEMKVETSLHLDVSIRSQGAEQVSNFVNALFDGKIDEAKELYKGIKKMHFRMYVTHDFKKIKDYCWSLYKDREDKRYGCITSSQNPKVSKRADIAGWFNADREAKISCCQMNLSQSEFDVEGLELDMPVIGWFDDLRWDGDTWIPYKRRYSQGNGYYSKDYLGQMFRCKIEDPDYRYRVNTYRVFLTRGRDGVIIYVPERETLKRTYKILREVGIEEL